MTVEEGEPLVCRACKQKPYAFERARSYGVYEGPLVRAILLLKWELWEMKTPKISPLVRKYRVMHSLGPGRLADRF